LPPRRLLRDPGPHVDGCRRCRRCRRLSPWRDACSQQLRCPHDGCRCI
jgi:hypothetical protein